MGILKFLELLFVSVFVCVLYTQKLVDRFFSSRARSKGKTLGCVLQLVSLRYDVRDGSSDDKRVRGALERMENTTAEKERVLCLFLEEPLDVVTFTCGNLSRSRRDKGTRLVAWNINNVLRHRYPDGKP